MRGSRVRVPLVALFLQQAVLASPSKVLFVCEISTSVVHGLPKKMSENAFMKATGTNNIGKMRSGKLSISEGTISKICNSLGVSYSWLKYGSGSMNGNMVIQLGETHQKIEESINEAFKHGIPMAQLINAGNVGDNSQNITTGTERAKEREEESFKDKNAQLIQIINAKDEIIKAKDSEIRLLRKILADNGIEV